MNIKEYILEAYARSTGSQKERIIKKLKEIAVKKYGKNITTSKEQGGIEYYPSVGWTYWFETPDNSTHMVSQDDL